MRKIFTLLLLCTATMVAHTGCVPENIVRQNVENDADACQHMREAAIKLEWDSSVPGSTIKIPALHKHLLIQFPAGYTEGTAIFDTSDGGEYTLYVSKSDVSAVVKTKSGTVVPSLDGGKKSVSCDEVSYKSVYKLDSVGEYEIDFTTKDAGSSFGLVVLDEHGHNRRD